MVDFYLCDRMSLILSLSFVSSLLIPSLDSVLLLFTTPIPASPAAAGVVSHRI